MLPIILHSIGQCLSFQVFLEVDHNPFADSHALADTAPCGKLAYSGACKAL